MRAKYMQVIPNLQSIDHVHIYVKSHSRALAWYQDVMGFVINERLKFWSEDANGPLFIEHPSSKMQLALVESSAATVNASIAFGVNGEQFMQWYQYLKSNKMLNYCNDHQVTWSLYFKDLDGNGLEITSHQHQFISRAMVS